MADAEVRVLYILADRLKRTVREILELPVWEFIGWTQYLAWEAEEHRKIGDHGRTSRPRKVRSRR